MDLCSQGAIVISLPSVCFLSLYYCYLFPQLSAHPNEVSQIKESWFYVSVCLGHRVSKPLSIHYHECVQVGVPG
jgi:hypothetical protein